MVIFFSVDTTSWLSTSCQRSTCPAQCILPCFVAVTISSTALIWRWVWMSVWSRRDTSSIFHFVGCVLPTTYFSLPLSMITFRIRSLFQHHGEESGMIHRARRSDDIDDATEYLHSATLPPPAGNCGAYSLNGPSSPGRPTFSKSMSFASTLALGMLKPSITFVSKTFTPLSEFNLRTPSPDGLWRIWAMSELPTSHLVHCHPKWVVRSSQYSLLWLFRYSSHQSLPMQEFAAQIQLEAVECAFVVGEKNA